MIYKAHFASQYQIVIISNSWKLFFFLHPPSTTSPQFVHLTPRRLSALHIYCECKWVSWKIMCNKILFPAKFMPAKRNAFGLVPLHWKVHEMMLHNDNASCASLSCCCRFIAEIYIFTAMILLDWLQLNPNYFHAHIAFNYFHSPCATSSSSLWMRNAGEKVNG